MAMSPEQQTLLVQCLRRERAITATKRPPKFMQYARLDDDMNRRFGPVYAAGEWFGTDREPLPEKYRVRYLRAIYKLQAAGFLDAHKYEGRLERVKLTAAGEKAAAELLAPESTPTGRAESRE